MAEAATPATTRPTPRRRTTAKAEPATAPAKAPTAPKPRAAKPAAAAVDSAVDDNGREVYAFDLIQQPDTKSYSVWSPPAGSGCVGKIYMPLGTREVRVRMTGGPAA